MSCKGPIKLSFSSWGNYLSCPRKYELRKVHGWNPVQHSSAFFFGSAFDESLNRVLKDKQMGQLKPIESYYLTFDRYWLKANPTSTDMVLSENEILSFKKNDMDEDLLTFRDRARARNQNHLVWMSMRRKGHLLLKAYFDQLLPLITEVISVQQEINLPGDDGDSLMGFVDLVARLNDGKVYIIDNKTAGRAYQESAAQLSPQLMNYSNMLGINDVAFFVVNKTTYKTQVIKARLNEISKDLMLESMGTVVQAIKAEIFPPNLQECFGKYGKCEYYDLCHKNDTNGLYVKEKK